MTLVELRCTRCNAPVDGAHAGVITCRYCGATLVTQAPAASYARAPAYDAAPIGTEIFVVLLGRVGPSNRDRMVRAVQDLAQIPLGVAIDLVARAPCEIPFGKQEEHAHAFLEQAREVGAAATLEKRVVPITVQPSMAIMLDSAGSNPISVIKVVRAHLDLGLREAKDLVESAPCQVTNSLEGARAKAFLADLVAAGASARVTRS